MGTAFQLFLWFQGVFLACQKQPIPVSDSVLIYNYSVKGLEMRSDFEALPDAGFLANLQLDECSGLVACSYNDQWLWAHNDGGDINRLFLVNRHNASDAGFVRIPSAGNRDAEDLALDWAPVQGKRYLYWGDIGDNNAVYPGLLIYRFEEPVLDSTKVPFDTASLPCERLTFVYEDGPRDAETLLIDPWSHDLYVVTKRENKARLYKAEFPFDVSNTDTLKFTAEFPFSGFVGGDVSRDGRWIAIKTYGQIYVWERNVGEKLEMALSRQPQILPYKGEVQGESFAWTYDGLGESPTGYVTVSEGAGAPLRRYRRVP